MFPGCERVRTHAYCAKCVAAFKATEPLITCDMIEDEVLGLANTHTNIDTQLAR